MRNSDISLTVLLQKTRELILRAQETVRHSHEVLRVSRELQADSERGEQLKVPRRSIAESKQATLAQQPDHQTLPTSFRCGNNSVGGHHELWRELYEVAAQESNHGLRVRRIIEAQSAILEHALFLEESQGSDQECRDLERAAEGLRRLKVACQMT